MLSEYSPKHFPFLRKIVKTNPLGIARGHMWLNVSGDGDNRLSAGHSSVSRITICMVLILLQCPITFLHVMFSLLQELDSGCLNILSHSCVPYTFSHLFSPRVLSQILPSGLRKPSPYLLLLSPSTYFLTELLPKAILLSRFSLNINNFYMSKISASSRFPGEHSTRRSVPWVFHYM